ncbi:DUF1287 domain-containing protein [Massilia forsythiae]|uniref:DUF1287 domain-containing protein n=1 Tax=Massilia forsythiae TaxID=2728020 RepID=UPI001B7D2407|nr:DUF1287 domain-containing protein [Massilia forsythiae]
MKSTDRNIDHRRVPNLETFFRRHGTVIALSDKTVDFHAGDIVVWQLPYSLPHIGIISERMSSNDTPLMIHNIASGVKLADMLFAFKN